MLFAKSSHSRRAVAQLVCAGALTGVALLALASPAYADWNDPNDPGYHDPFTNAYPVIPPYFLYPMYPCGIADPNCSNLQKGLDRLSSGSGGAHPSR
jgi:hypothetical protein